MKIGIIDADLFKRIEILNRYQCLPYIMKYENYQHSKYKALYVNIARWCNMVQFYKKTSFREFCELNQKYHKNKDTNCLAYQSMLDFEREHPRIAKKYFGMKADYKRGEKK